MKSINLALAVVTTLIEVFVFAHTGAKGVFKQCMDAMGDKSKIVADMMKEKVECCTSELTMDDRSVIADYFMSDANQP